MKRMIAATIMVLLLVSVSSLTFSIQIARAEPTTITVPDDYLTIQEAIDHANEGDTVFVRNRTYCEHIVLNKAISVVGENRETTIIDGNSTGTILNVVANDTVFSGFTLQNGQSGASIPWSDSMSLRNNNISYNDIRNCFFGIDSWGNFGVITYNNISDCDFAMRCGGIGLTVGYNKVVSCEEGIWVIHDNTVIGNALINNRCGIYFGGSDNFLRNNSMMSNEFNFGHISVNLVWVEPISVFNNDVDTSNTINGKPIYYWINKSDTEIPSDAAYVELVNCTNVSVRNLNLSNNGISLLLANTNNCVIENLNMTHNDEWSMALCCGSHNNTVRNNLISSSYIGIELAGLGLCTTDNWISDNQVANCHGGIVVRGNCSYTRVLRNDIADNYYGVTFSLECENNLVFHNNFVNNTHQADNDQSDNIWDDGYPSGGNYWSDYIGVDSDFDGVGDTQYTIDSDNVDNYPLVGRFSDFNATSQYCVQTICNSSISDFKFNGTAITFNVYGENGTSFFCRICIPTGLMDGPFHVFVNGTEVSYDMLPCSNSTHSYLNFNCTLSTEQIVIIPELPSLFILLLFMIATLIGVFLITSNAWMKGRN